MKVLAVGPEFNVHSELRFEVANWTDEYNIKDNHAVFLDLEDIYENPGDYHPPTTSTKDSINFPSKNDVDKHTWNRNDIFVRLPPETEVDIPKPDGGAETVNLLQWLPFKIHTDSSESGGHVSMPVNIPSISENSDRQKSWRWYFTPPEFSWDLRLTGVTAWPGEEPDHSTRLRIDEEDTRIGRREGQPEKGHLSRIASTNADELIAAKLTFESTYKHSGDVYLLPSRQQSFAEFVIDILRNWSGWTKSEIRLDPAPLWTADVTIPGESELEAKAAELETELEQLQQEAEYQTRYKQMLYADDNELEEVVRDAFREFGLTVDGEVPGKWDGVVHLEDREYILEATGVKGGVKGRKISQLDKHREGYESTRVDPDDVYMMLVVNTYKEENPVDRELMEGNFIDRLEGTNKHVMTAKSLYSLLHAYFEGDMSEEDIQELILESDTIIRYDSEDDLWGGAVDKSVLDRISSLMGSVRQGLL